MSKKLDRKICVVTGGSVGIGLGIAKRFVSEGAFVFVVGRRQAELDEAVAELGPAARGLRGDISSLSDLDEIYATIAREAGQIDVVVANAGIYEAGTMGEITETHFDKIFGVNVRGLLFTVQKALPLLVDGGSVILTGSICGQKGFPSFSVYDASKAAVRSFARGWIVDLKARRIRVNVLSPGTIATPGLDTLVGDAGVDSWRDIIPMGRIGEADEIGKAAVFLASDDSSFTTGSELFVDGGAGQI